MNKNMYETALTQENPMRITRLVSVILNGVVFDKLATRHSNDAEAMAASLMLNLPHTVQNNIRAHELSQVTHQLRAEIGQRLNASQD